jgi:hypothetical protein
LFNDVWVERENLSIKIGLDFQTDSTAREIEKGLLEIIWKFGGGTCQKGLTDKPVTDFLLWHVSLFLFVLFFQSDFSIVFKSPSSSFFFVSFLL